MRINLIATGKLKEKYLVEAQEFFLSSINKKNKIDINISELPDLAAEDGLSKALEDKVKILEGEQVLNLIKSKEKSLQSTYLVLLDLEGKCARDESFKEILNEANYKNKESITFVIGGSLGNSDELKRKADMKISFSKLTYPHQLFRIILLNALKNHL